MSAPTSPTAQGGGAEVVFGQILQTMQAGMQQMAQDSQQRFELLERGLREQSQFLQASATAQMTALETLSKKSNVVDVKGVGKPDVLKGSHEEAKRAWKSWAYKFESWFVSQYPDAGQQALDWSKEKGDTTIFDSEGQHLNRSTQNGWALARRPGVTDIRNAIRRGVQCQEEVWTGRLEETEPCV